MGRCSSLERGQTEMHLGISTQGGIEKQRGPRPEPGYFCPAGQGDEEENRHRD